MRSVVLLRRFGPCPACGNPRRAYTHPTAGTRLAACSPRRCRIARTLALAAAPYPSWYEPAPLTDRRSA